MANFVSKVHSLNQAEVQFGHLAQSQGKSHEVQRYGDMLVKDHEQADRDLLKLAKDENIDLQEVKLAEKPVNRAPIDELNRLRERRGPGFDQAFLTTMVKEHEKAIGLVKGALHQFQGTKLAELLQQKALPTLEHHRDLARDLLKQHQPAAARRTPPAR
jgi:putative membrane protein